jgi:hypothetical protein
MPEALKATKAREITKESVTDSGGLDVRDRNGALVSTVREQGMQAGDFYFRPTIIQHIITSPWYRRWFLREKTQLTHEAVTCVVISCPVCGLPILTNPSHRITDRTPLTIDREIACPYAPAGLAGAHAFSIKEGNIIAA